MLLGAVTYNVLNNMDLATVIRTLETAAFDAVELRTGHKHGVEPTLSDAERSKVKDRFEHSKVRLLSFGTTCEFQSADAAERKKRIALAKDFVGLAHDTGALGVKVRPNGLAKGVPKETTIQNIAAGLREVGEHGYLHGVEIWLEVHGGETQVPGVVGQLVVRFGVQHVALFQRLPERRVAHDDGIDHAECVEGELVQIGRAHV